MFSFASGKSLNPKKQQNQPPTDWTTSAMRRSKSGSGDSAEDPKAEDPKADVAKTAKKKSKLQMLRDGYEGLVSAVVRPPRSNHYSPDADLGPKRLKLDSGTHMRRDDFTLTNYQGMKLQCSIWQPSALYGGDGDGNGDAVEVDVDMPCPASPGTPGGGGSAPKATTKMAVVYLHGNSSCRVDATRTGVLETVGPLKAALVAFDFAGSGLSDGEFVTLGWVRT